MSEMDLACSLVSLQFGVFIFSIPLGTYISNKHIGILWEEIGKIEGGFSKNNNNPICYAFLFHCNACSQEKNYLLIYNFMLGNIR